MGHAWPLRAATAGTDRMVATGATLALGGGNAHFICGRFLHTASISILLEDPCIQRSGDLLRIVVYSVSAWATQASRRRRRTWPLGVGVVSTGSRGLLNEAQPPLGHENASLRDRRAEGKSAIFIGDPDYERDLPWSSVSISTASALVPLPLHPVMYPLRVLMEVLLP
ncbi:hypothetical protein HPB51_002926 [Rhipicephalus microplus]|uniref:Uncharacterized protein n=1 Tax=Rhipicephalus microplus TaxID=6941 RepID=A0A9J6DST3_RHIMP|nr:hypothetical protein HPB51_002926 [Rhipicephalus microplus]